jgi:thymidine kinase
MFAKKTTMLISRLHDLNEEGYRVLYINSKKDKLRCKDDQPFSTHNTSMASTRITCWENRAVADSSSTIHGKMVTDLMHPKTEAMCEDYDVIGIDEAQFFDNIYEFCEAQMKKNRYVIVTGLDSNFEMKPFVSVVALAALSESFVKVPAVCRQCRDEQANDGQPCRAYFTRRIVPAIASSSSSSTNGSVIDPGGKEKYEAVCRRHHTIPASVSL